MRRKDWMIWMALVLLLGRLRQGQGDERGEAGRQDKPPESAAHGAENHPGEHEEPAKGCWWWTPRCCAT